MRGPLRIDNEELLGPSHVAYQITEIKVHVPGDSLQVHLLQNFLQDCSFEQVPGVLIRAAMRRPKVGTKDKPPHRALRGRGEVGLDWLEHKPKESSNGEPPGAGLHSIYTRIHVGCARLFIGLCTVHDICYEHTEVHA